jgi:succinate dehydrogenase/fumarate reductase flavoprotein subunit
LLKLSEISYPRDFESPMNEVENTREKRLKQRYSSLSLEEREQLLKAWHPDYKEGTKRPLVLGSNKGDAVPHEVADLIEAYPLVDPKEMDLSKIDNDAEVLIIGGGGAGAAAALWANHSGVKSEDILITTKLRFGDSNTMMAQGGIQAADRPEDTPVIHYLDIVGGGHFTNKPELVKALVEDAPSIIKWHEELGIIYDKNDDGEMIEIHGGGTSKRRMHTCKDYTGLEIMRVLKDEVLNKEIPVLEFSSAIELLTDDEGGVSGALLWNLETKEYHVVRAKAVVLATGGFGRLHIQGFPTTNHYGATMDGIVMAYRAGAKLRDMDSSQYHPTGVAYPEQIFGLLITEKVRSLGAQLVHKDGEQFIYQLEPRDVVSSAIIKECYGDSKGVTTPTGAVGVWLDIPMIEELRGKGAVKKLLPAMYRQYRRFGIDISQDPVLTFPTLHYQNGGIAINENTEVLDALDNPMHGFYAAGEVGGGVHGKNRLMGNSLLGINVFGRRAGMSAANYVKRKSDKPKLSLAHVSRYVKMLKKASIPAARKSPMVLPEYREKDVLSRALPIFPI